jgi:hypothetical protein
MNYNKVKPGDKVPCHNCGEEFEAVHYSQHYCSDMCRAESKVLKDYVSYKKSYIKRRKKDGYKTKYDKGMCDYCGNEFNYKHNSLQKYCSSLCKSRAKREKETGVKRNTNCAECGKVLARGQRIYCSQRCSSKKHSRYYKPEAKKYKKVCRCCHELFESDSNRNYFCSTGCLDVFKERSKYYKTLKYVVYLFGHEEQPGIYLVKIGKTSGNNLTHRLDSIQTSNPMLLNEYGIFEFNTEQESLDYENLLHESTIQYTTSADNEWRRLTADTLIDICEHNNLIHRHSGVYPIVPADASNRAS